MRKGKELPPFMHGGQQEREYRAGTENVASIVGFGTAAEIANSRMESESDRLTKMGFYFIDRVLSGISGVELTGSNSLRIPGHCSFVIEGIEGEALQSLLDLKDIYVSTGSACTSGIGMPSHVLSACGYDPALANGMVRITFGYGNDDDDPDVVYEALKKSVEQLRNLGNILK